MRIGPRVSAPPIFDSSLQAMLAELRSGNISTLAPPFKVLNGYICSRSQAKGLHRP